jgi:hypothetical protein
MDPFSYLVVLTSIVLGLGVTRLVGGLGHLMQTRKRRWNYWVHTLWMINVLLVMSIVWWFAYRWRANEHWTFFLFLWLLLSPIVLYLIASLLFPDPDEAHVIADWRTYYYENQRDIFLLLALIFPIDVIDTLLKGMAHFREQGPAYFVTMVLWFVLLLIAAWTKRPGYHAFIAVLFLVYNLALLGASLLTEQGAIAPFLIQSQ